MTTCEALPGVTVTIDTADGPLKEYDETDADADNESNKHTATRYIEAQSDQEFKVVVTIEKDAKFLGDCMSIVVEVDGRYADGFTMYKHWSTEKPATSTSEGALRGGQVRKYKFAELAVTETTEDKSKERPKDLGSIRVDILHLKSGFSQQQTAVGRDVQEIGPVSEKALKGSAISHNVGFGDAVAAAAGAEGAYWDVDAVPEVDNVGATFIFNCRSQESLKSMLIIPRTPSPTPPRQPTPLEDRPVESLSDDELREIARRMQQQRREAREAASIKIKREITEEDERRRKRARPNQGDTQLELDDEGGVREVDTTGLPPKEIEVIELDDD